MNVKRIISVILIVVLLSAIFTGCNNVTYVPGGLDADGKFIYAVVRPSAEENTQVLQAAKVLRSAIKETFGGDIYYLKDDASDSNNDSYEILIGDTNRQVSADVKAILINNRINHANDFIIKSVGKKIVIQAVSKDVLPFAIEWFAKTFCTSVESWSKLTTDYQFIYEYSGTVLGKDNLVSGADLGSCNVVLPRQVSYIVGMGGETFRDYYNQYGYNVMIIDDFDPKDETECEVIIGDTTRKESEQVKAEGDNYVIKVIGKKVVIKGGNDLATWRGVKEFLKYVIDGNGFNWSDGFTINGRYDSNEEGAYTLNWNDEFEGSSIDLTKWGDYYKESDNSTASCLGGKMYYADQYGESAYKGDFKKAIYLSDGDLVLTAQRLNEKDFLATKVSTYYTMLCRYGIMEVRLKFPQAPAATSYWFNGVMFDDAYERWGEGVKRTVFTEIDVVENFGRVNNFASNVHRWWQEYDVNGKQTGSNHNSMDGIPAYNGNSENNKRFWYDFEKYGENFEDDYHIITLYWDDSRMKFCVDGKAFCDYDYNDNNSVSVHNLMNYLILGTHLGEASYGETFKPDKHDDYFEERVDYVRIYQTDAVNSQMVTAWPEKQKTGELKIFYPEHSYGNDY